MRPQFGMISLQIMNVFSFIAATGLVGVGVSALTACRKEEAKPGPPAAALSRVPLVPVSVEVRPDGLAYLAGSVTPFTGKAVTPFADAPWLPKLEEPYTDGQRDGDKVEFFKNGKIKSLRRYDKGLPKYTASYHRNGQIKYEVHLNAQDRGEGPYQRWYETGMLEATAGLDSEERWHGEFKEWTPEGILKTHHIFKNGLLQQIIFETPESQEARKAAGVELENPVSSPAMPKTEKKDP